MEENLVKDENQVTIETPEENFNNQGSKPKLTLTKVTRFLHSQQGWLFILPAVILLAIFTFYPIINTFISAFIVDYNRIDALQEIKFGFSNFAKVISGETATGGAKFMNCLINTLIFTFVSVPISTILALLISVALSSIKVLQKAYQTVFFLPYLTNALAMGAVFKTLFNVVGTGSSVETVGLVNTLLGPGLSNAINSLLPYVKNAPNGYVNWMGAGSTIQAKRIVVIVYEIWAGLPFKILILFSALQNVNKQYYDAARVDGASKSRILWKITVPMISPMLSYLLVTGIMGGMKVYTAVVGLFTDKMGIEFEVGTMVGYMYNYIEDGNIGYAAAGSLILFGIIMIITIINLYISKKKVYY